MLGFVFYLVSVLAQTHILRHYDAGISDRRRKLGKLKAPPRLSTSQSFQDVHCVEKQENLLFDIIHDSAPPSKWGPMRHIPDVLLSIHFLVPFFILFGIPFLQEPLTHDGHPSPRYTGLNESLLVSVSIVQHMLILHACLLWIRLFTVVSTALPSPVLWPRPPFSGMSYDLNISGHTITSTLFSLLITHYLYTALFQDPSWRVISCFIFIATWGTTLYQSFLLSASREHYTADVVLALFLTSLMYKAFPPPDCIQLLY